MASSHVSKFSIDVLKKHDINYVTIPGGMIPISYPLDIAVNKTFKDHIKLLFEKEGLFYDNIILKMKLDKARINLLNYINNVWNKMASKKLVLLGIVIFLKMKKK